MPDATESGVPLTLGEMETSVSFMLRMAEVVAYEAVSSLQSDLDLSLPEQTVLVAVAMNPDARQGAIADLLRIRWPNMTKLVARLEKRGLISRTVSPDDRRAVTLAPTDEGRQMALQVKARLVSDDTKAISMLSESERETLATLLRKVIGWPSTGPQKP